jgi:signal transduction histidine kinase
LVTKFPVIGTDGQAVAVGGVIVNLSDRKRAEDALQASEERHRRFAADVAHELRTPLAVLRSNLDNFGSDEGAASLRHDIDAMTRMVEQLLAATRLEILDIIFGDEADLRGVCVLVAELLAPLAIKENRSIEIIGADAPVMIRGNADALEQAVRNLVENAIRYSPPQTTVTIDVGEEGIVWVIDRGEGIPPEARDRVFERFQRADRRGGGAGLGLAIVRRTAEAHHGSIDVDDAPGGGAIFTLRLPIERLVVSAPPAQ